MLAQRLVRFVAGDGKTYYGDAILPRGVTDVSKALKANLIEGDIFNANHKVTEKIMVLYGPKIPHYLL